MRISGHSCRRPAHRLGAAVGAWLLLLPAAVPVRAQEGEPPPAAVEAPAGERQASTVPPRELPPSGIEVAGEAIPLSLEEAVTTALQRNLGLLIERYERAQFRLRIDEN